MPFPGGGFILFWSTYIHTHDRLDKLCSALAEAQLKKLETETNQGLREFQQLACMAGYCKMMIFSSLKFKMPCYHPLKGWLLRVTNGNQGKTIIPLLISDTMSLSMHP